MAARAGVDKPVAAASDPDKLDEQAEEPAVRAGRQLMIGIFAGVLILETVALLVVGTFFGQIGSAAIRIPIHLICFALLWAGVPEMRPIYVFILGAVGGFSVYQFFDAGLRGAGIPDALRLICGVLFLLFAHRLLTDRDIDKFLALRRGRLENE